MHLKVLLAVLCCCASFSSAARAENPAANLHDLYRDTPEASIYRGDLVFHNYCQLCHGPNADGKGRAAKMYNPKPANLRASTYNSEYKEMIVRKGGKEMGRSEFMPPWGEELTDEQITDVIHYIDSIVGK